MCVSRALLPVFYFGVEKAVVPCGKHFLEKCFPVFFFVPITTNSGVFGEEMLTKQGSLSYEKERPFLCKNDVLYSQARFFCFYFLS